MYPAVAAAVVPVYNLAELKALTGTDNAVVMTRELVAKVFMGVRPDIKPHSAPVHVTLRHPIRPSICLNARSAPVHIHRRHLRCFTAGPARGTCSCGMTP